MIACSAGNHAQGVALAAQKLGIKACVVMPFLTPPIKWKNVQRLGAEILLHGDDFDAAKEECYRLAKVSDACFFLRKFSFGSAGLHFQIFFFSGYPSTLRREI